MPDLIFDTLNDPQRHAVGTLQGPVLILAGAGSGKTRALTHRIAHLIAQGVPPWQILAVTFTNKAADEMKQRIRTLLGITEGRPSPTGREARLPVMGTFHATCARILRREIAHLGRDRDFVIYDQDDQEKLMKHVLRELRTDESTLKPRTTLAHLGRFKCEALNPREVAEQSTTEFTALLAKIYAHYQTALRGCNALDFDDLILETVRLFVEAPHVLDRYQETWRFLNVDEYQDTNHAQYLFLSKLAEKYRNLCVIGDPDQSIYAFRGADIRNILEFQEEHRDATVITLEQNYRSTRMILDASNAVIAANPCRPAKSMWTQRKDTSLLIVHECADETQEAEEIIRAAQEALGRGIPLREQVVLYRTNAQSRLFEEACMRLDIPYRIVGGLKFYARREVKDVLAYLALLVNSGDVVSLLRVLNVPSRKIGETTLRKLQEFCTAQGCSLWEGLKHAGGVGLPEATATRITSFVTLIEEHHALSDQLVVADLTAHLLAAVKMEKWVRDDTTEGESRWENIQELLSVMRKYDALPPRESLQSLLEEVALVSEVDALTEAKGDALTLMTLHLCKGLEFRCVTIAGCEEGLLPMSAALFDKDQLEEERRLMYVGMTRAKDELRLTFAQRRLLWGDLQTNAPSRFLDDLPQTCVDRRSFSMLSPYLWKRDGKIGEASPGSQDLSDLDLNQDILAEQQHLPRGKLRAAGLAAGMRVGHPVFGKGTIMSKRGDVVEITFDSGAKKKFALSIAPLKKLE